MVLWKFFNFQGIWGALTLTDSVTCRALQPSLLAWQYGDLTPGEVILPWLDNYLQGSHHHPPPPQYDLTPTLALLQPLTLRREANLLECCPAPCPGPVGGWEAG